MLLTGNERGKLGLGGDRLRRLVQKQICWIVRGNQAHSPQEAKGADLTLKHEHGRSPH